MAWWFCEAKQYDPETFKGFGVVREIVEATSPKYARVKFENIAEDSRKSGSFARLLLETYGFFGPFESRETARNIKHRYIRKKKRHCW